MKWVQVGQAGALFAVLLLLLSASASRSLERIAVITHAGWTALAGVGVGLVSLHRHRRPALVAGLALMIIPIVDHASVNWTGDGTEFIHSITGDGHVAAWLLIAAVIGVLVHDTSTLRWASERDRLFPVPTIASDLAGLTEGAVPRRLSGLVNRQRYRRRRNATFVDLFSVRSLGVQAVTPSRGSTAARCRRRNGYLVVEQIDG